ncbi:hypothetical protein OIU77_023984 [Salix suchowensis]|uniref:Uncharacterized protein n=1 Tax=Salix suchowensis TaxID=1278906 RepID=A0ABQ9C5T6_9ROSI|nr:hypothetical protein OIU77_023984 [Salix suchowensis]
MQSAVWNPTHCRAQQTLDTSCSSPPPPPQHHKSCKGFLGAHARNYNQLRQGIVCRSLRIRLPSFTQRRLVVKGCCYSRFHDGGNVALHEIDGNVVRLKLQVAVEAISDEDTGLELMEENIEKEFWNIFLHQQVNLHWCGFCINYYFSSWYVLWVESAV